MGRKPCLLYRYRVDCSGVETGLGLSGQDFVGLDFGGGVTGDENRVRVSGTVELANGDGSLGADLAVSGENLFATDGAVCAESVLFPAVVDCVTAFGGGYECFVISDHRTGTVLGCFSIFFLFQ